MVGHVIGERYEITELMIPGRLSDFWSAKDLKDGSAVAVKLMNSDLLLDRVSLARFEREIKLLSEWKHPNLLRVIDSGRTEAGVPWLATRVTRVRPLYDEIADQSAPVKVVARVAAQIARVLAGAHARGHICAKRRATRSRSRCSTSAPSMSTPTCSTKTKTRSR